VDNPLPTLPEPLASPLLPAAPVVPAGLPDRVVLPLLDPLAVPLDTPVAPCVDPALDPEACPDVAPADAVSPFVPPEEPQAASARHINEAALDFMQSP
jgi:hypothetical protein